MLEQYYRINEATGVSITVDSTGNAAINACSITIANNQLNIEKKIIDLKSVEELTKQLPPKSIIALNLSGKGILQKRVEKIEEINQNTFSKILPNANLDDFYVQNFFSGDKSFISIIRKAEADKWIAQLKKNGFIPLMLSLGPFPVQNIITQLNIYGNEIVFDGHSIKRDEHGNWISHQYIASTVSPFPIKIESEAIDEKLIIPYAAAFQLVLGEKVEAFKTDVTSIDKEFQKHLADKKLKAKGFLILVVFFLLLLVNFFLFSWLNSNNAKLTEQVSISAQSTNDIQGINEQIQQKEALLKTLGWEEHINKAVLIDQLAALLPNDITWREAAVDPIDLNASRSQKVVTFFYRKIRITGNAEKIMPVNEWMARIKTKKWVKNVQLDSYTYNSELNTGQFTILIDY